MITLEGQMSTQLEHDVVPLVLDLPDNGTRWAGLLEVFQAYHRWQNGYSPCQVAAQAFFQRPARGLCSLHRDYPRHRHYLLQQALPACLPGWAQGLAVSFGSEQPGELPLASIVVPSGPGTWGAALDDARVGYESPTGERVMARVSLNHQGGEEVACFTLIGTTEQAAFLRDLLDRIEAWMDANPHLRGAKLDAKGKFLTLDRSYTWDDIVLGPTTRAEIDGHILQFVERLPRYQAFGLPVKRGILLVGPPGTGKTLLGKVLCCTVPTTFLWVSPGEIEGPARPPAALRPGPGAPADGPVPRRPGPVREPPGERGRRPPRGAPEPARRVPGEQGHPHAGHHERPPGHRTGARRPAQPLRPPDRPGAPEGPGAGTAPGAVPSAAPASGRGAPGAGPATDGFTGAHLQELVHRAVQLALDTQAAEATDVPHLTAEHLRQALHRVRRHRPGAIGFYA